MENPHKQYFPNIDIKHLDKTNIVFTYVRKQDSNGKWLRLYLSKEFSYSESRNDFFQQCFSATKGLIKEAYIYIQFGSPVEGMLNPNTMEVMCEEDELQISEEERYKQYY